MTFLVWPNEDHADASMVALNAMYGCPYEDANGYKMDKWDEIKESDPPGNYGFYKPEERLGQVMVDLMGVLVGDFAEHDEIPDEFVPEVEV